MASVDLRGQLDNQQKILTELTTPNTDRIDALGLAMKLLQALALASLPLQSFAAKKPAEIFSQYHEKFLSSAPLKLDDSSYEALTTTPRDYGVAVLLTALEARFGCALCREFQPEWEVLAKSWARGDKKGKTRMLYGTLDFTDGKATFQKVRVDFNHLRKHC